MCISWTAYRNEFASWSLDIVRKDAKEAEIAVEDIDRFVSHPQESNNLEQELARVWRDRASWPDHAGLQAYYLYMRCLKSWEFSIDHEPIEDLIDAGQTAWENTPRSMPGRHSIDVLMQHIQTLKVCMMVENGLLCSCPSEMATQARRVVSQSREQLVSLTPIEDPNSFSALVEHVLKVHICYFGALSEMANSLICVLSKCPMAIAALTHTIQRLSSTERAPLLTNSLYAPPLRAHRSLLDAYHKRLQDPDSPELKFLEARVTYVYPFTLEGCGDPRGAPHCAEAAEGLKAGDLARKLWGKNHSSNELENERKDPVRALDAVDMALTDIWSLSDPDSRHGTVVKMPGVEVTTTAPDPKQPGRFVKLPQFDVEIWLARFGNHHVRIQTPVTALSLHELNQALRRGSQWMGPEVIRGGDPGYSGLANFVTDLVEVLAKQLGAELKRECRGDCHQPEPRVRAHMNIDADYHAIVEVRAASVPADGGEKPATSDDIRKLAGSLLFQPIERLPITLEEWICNRTPQNVPNLLGESRFDHDFASRSTNTTVLFLPQAPSWGYLSLMEMAEYTATLPALLRMWKRALDQKHHTALNQLTAWKEPGSRTSSRRDDAKLDKIRLDLSEFIARVRARHTLLNSTHLVHSDAHRTFLDNLMSKADMRRLMAELDGQIQQTDQLYAYMVEYERTLEEKRRRRFEMVVEVILAFVAAFSLAGMFSYIHSLRVGGDYVVGMNSDEWGELWVFAGICAVALIIVIVAFFVWRRR